MAVSKGEERDLGKQEAQTEESAKRCEEPRRDGHKERKTGWGKKNLEGQAAICSPQSVLFNASFPPHSASKPTVGTLLAFLGCVVPSCHQGQPAGEPLL